MTQVCAEARGEGLKHPVVSILEAEVIQRSRRCLTALTGRERTQIGPSKA
jgi:hypothetical protein